MRKPKFKIGQDVYIYIPAHKSIIYGSIDAIYSGDKYDIYAHELHPMRYENIEERFIFKTLKGIAKTILNDNAKLTEVAEYYIASHLEGMK